MNATLRTAEADMLLETMRTQIQSRRRLRELHGLTRPTDDERDEAWRLQRALRKLAIEARRVRRENVAKARVVA